METAPTSIEVLLRPTLGQSDEPSDLRGSLSPTSVYSTWQSPGGHPSSYEPGATSLNFSDRANHDERTPYSYYHLYDETQGQAQGWVTLTYLSRSQRLINLRAYNLNHFCTHGIYRTIKIVRKI